MSSKILEQLGITAAEINKLRLKNMQKVEKKKRKPRGHYKLKPKAVEPSNKEVQITITNFIQER